MNKIVMAVSKQDLTHDDEAYNDILQEWGERVTIVDFGYNSKGKLTTVLMMKIGILNLLKNNSHYR